MSEKIWVTPTPFPPPLASHHRCSSLTALSSLLPSHTTPALRPKRSRVTHKQAADVGPVPPVAVAGRVLFSGSKVLCLRSYDLSDSESIMLIVKCYFRLWFFHFFFLHSLLSLPYLCHLILQPVISLLTFLLLITSQIALPLPLLLFLLKVSPTLSNLLLLLSSLHL